MSVRLTGVLICADPSQAELVRRHLPAHVAATLAEPGCVSFSVTPDPADALRWRVSEQFADADAFDAHQLRVASSNWGRATAGFERQYEITGR